MYGGDKTWWMIVVINSVDDWRRGEAEFESSMSLVWRTECAKPTIEKISRTSKLKSPHFHTQKSGILTIYVI